MEEWKDVKGYEGYYQVSSLGRVRCVDRVVRMSNGSFRFCRSKLLKPLSNRGGGQRGQKKGRYLYVNLTRDHGYKSIFIHRLVLENFIPNPDPSVYTQCNHIDEDTFNNCVSNLEWCTPKQNVNYGTRNERANAPLRKRVKMYTKDGVFIREFTSTREAERQTGICSSSICCCCNKKPKFFTAGGYRWQYAQLAQEGGDVQ